MVSFIVCLAALIVGYFTYGKFVERIVSPDPNRKTPAVNHPDGIDNVPLPGWRIFLIQFLNIAGVGPIFGAILGAKYGVSSYLWIVLGSIFAGAVHDYTIGMLSVRNDGASLPEIVGKFLGKNAKLLMRIVCLVLLILLGAVFVSSPAGLLEQLTDGKIDFTTWVIIIFGYYMVASLLPIDKIIGKIYPLFGIALLFMEFGILTMLFVIHPDLPEISEGLHNTNPNGLPIFPIMFISIACGAISGFHGTQSPLMARCMTSEKQGRPIFYGAMILEGIEALIWAAAATYFYHNTPDGMSVTTPSIVVNSITSQWLGVVGAILAVCGVVAAPITSGDTALRSARLIMAEFLRLDQGKLVKRLMIGIPIFAITAAFLIYSMKNADGFDTIWRYFAWTNQMLALFSLWTITVFFAQTKRNFYIALVPALFMTTVIFSYICVAPEGFGLSRMSSYIVGFVATIALFVWFTLWYNKNKNSFKREV